MASIVLGFDDAPPVSFRGGAVAVGNFDGVHLGHAALAAELRTQAQRVAGPAVVVTLDPHPIALLAPERLQPLLTTPTDRVGLFEAAGVDCVVVLRTTTDLLRLEPLAFLDGLLEHKLAAKAVVEGFNFRFGRGRAGNNELLSTWCQDRGLSLTIVPPISLDSAVVSSSRVRSAVVEGDMSTATRLLGRPYRLRGVVGAGAQRGRTLGFPTANLERLETLVPGDGVYAIRTILSDGSIWPGAANIGSNPTFGEMAHKVEVHLIGFSGDLYGSTIALDFLARLRSNRAFAGPKELVAQLEEDVRAVRKIDTGGTHVVP